MGSLQKKEKVLHGVPASAGIAVGTAYLFTKEIPRVEERSLDGSSVDVEIRRAMAAIEKSAKELGKILVFARQKVGDAKARVVEAQIMIVEDHILIEALKQRIQSEKKNAEFIVRDEI